MADTQTGKGLRRVALWLTALAGVVLSVACLVWGSVDIPPEQVWAALTGGEVERQAWRVIVIDSRLPMTLTALVAGAALAVAGLMLQTAFSNPLAGPSVMGVSTGASLGVALVILLFGGTVAGYGGSLGALIGALIGAVGVIGVLWAMSAALKSSAMLLIAGIMVGYVTSAIISILSYFAPAAGLQGYVVWGLGSFATTSFPRLWWMLVPTLATLLISLLLIKPMDALLLGERYAESMGVGIRRVRSALLLISGALTAFVTAFCGPIGFIGLTVPHIARFLTATSSHRTLLPATILTGATTGVLCAALTLLPAQGVLPVNAVTPLIGVPVILYILLRRKHLHYFN